MAEDVLVDAGFLVALLSGRDTHHRWAATRAANLPPPWQTCEAVLSEAFHLLGSRGRPALTALLRRDALRSRFDFESEQEPVLKLMHRYAAVPMSFADACLVRMTEKLASCRILTTDADFRIYRRHGRQVVPCELPSGAR